jgi:DNA-binding NarL/FixJ family response regulator
MKILVIDDHPLVVDALAQLLPQIGPSDGGSRGDGPVRSDHRA